MRTNSITRFSIVAAALLLSACGGGGGGSSSAPGSSPATLVSISMSPLSVLAGQTASITWSSPNATSCTASDAWSGALDTSGNRTITQSSPGSYAYTVTCTGPGGSNAGTAKLTVSAAPNTLSITMDGGPAGNALNSPYVSVTVCVPGTSNCQTVDHVLMDTGSFGLRLIKPGLLNAGLNLPAVTTSDGNELGACAVFADGFTWGTVRRADVKLGGETAASIPIQTIGDQPGGAVGVPLDCSATGLDESTVAKLGANGILGIGMFVNDCDVCTTHVIPATYYSCKAAGCAGTRITAAQAVTNPVAHFSQDNNGVLVILPAVTDAGAANPSGTLIFGIGTQANNALDNATVYAVDDSGNFSTTYKGKTTANSFADSGSNAIFFADTTLAQCKLSTGFYCPPTPLALSATIKAAGGNASASVNFGIVNIDTLPNGITAANAGGGSIAGSGGASFDWGLPFFFGRKVYTAIYGTATPGGSGPYLAF